MTDAFADRTLAEHRRVFEWIWWQYPERPTGETPRERIIAVAPHRFAIDHRALTSIEIRRDWTDQAPYELGRHQQ